MKAWLRARRKYVTKSPTVAITRRPGTATFSWRGNVNIYFSYLNTYPNFPTGLRTAFPFDSFHSYCILCLLRTIESDWQGDDMSLRLLSDIVKIRIFILKCSPHKWSELLQGNMIRSARGSSCSLGDVLSILTKLSWPFPLNPLLQPRKGQGRSKKGPRIQPVHTDTCQICSCSGAQKEHLSDNLPLNNWL